MNNEPPSTPPIPPSSADDSLQFEKAEFSQASALNCSFCKAPITGTYFQVNNQIACPNCRGQLEAHLGQGSKGSRMFMALGAGLAAAIAGCLVYWGIRAAS